VSAKPPSGLWLLQTFAHLMLLGLILGEIATL
jgi:hypothetical protein